MDFIKIFQYCISFSGKLPIHFSDTYLVSRWLYDVTGNLHYHRYFTKEHDRVDAIWSPDKRAFRKQCGTMPNFQVFLRNLDQVLHAHKKTYVYIPSHS